jgi:hypothetical protein
MKKFLYGTTALAAVGLAAGPALAQADPLHMELGGYYQQFFGFTDQNDISTENGFMNYQNAEVYFKMRGELDNGLKIGGRIELEGENGGDQIDQAYLTLSGGFGQLRLGAVNSGRYSYGWNTAAPAVGSPVNSGWTSTWLTTLNNSGARFRSVGISTVIDASNDEQKITYFTPRFNGFQFTGSWTPQAHIATSGSVGQGGGSPFGSESQVTDYTNALDFGVSYSGEFGGAGVEVQAGVATASAPAIAQAPTSKGGTGSFDDYLAYNGGVLVSFQGFTVAGSFAKISEGLALSCTSNGSSSVCASSNEGRSYEVGAGYETGPWGFSASYFNGKEEGLFANAGDEENEFFTVAGSYTLGPGIRTSLSYLHGKKDADVSGANGVADNKADAVLWGVHLGF